MAPQSLNLRTLAIKAEDTKGTYNAPLDADFNVKVYNVELSIGVEYDDDSTKYATGNHAEDVAVSGKRVGTLSCSIKLPAGATAATAPNAWKFLEACGASKITYTTTGVALVGRAAADDVTYSICMRDTTIGASPVYTEYRLQGAIGNAVISSEGIGMPIIAQCTFNVVINDIIDGSGLAVTSPDAGDLQKLLNSTVTLQGEAARISSFEFDFGNEINEVGDQSTAQGVAYYVITGRRPRLSCNPLAKNQADWDVYGSAVSDTPATCSITTSDYTLKILNGQMMNPTLASREGLINWDLNFRALGNKIDGTLIDSDLTEEDTWELLQGARVV